MATEDSLATLVRGGQVIVGVDDGRPTIVAGGAVAIEDALIVAVGGYADLSARFPDAAVVGSDQHIVMPGLINAHHHGVGLSPFELGALDDELELWIASVGPLPWPLDAYLETLCSALRLLRSGVTSVAHFGSSRTPGDYIAEARATLEAYRDAGIRVSFGLHQQDRNTFVYQDDGRFLAGLPSRLAGRARVALDELSSPKREAFEALLGELLGTYRDAPLVSLFLCAEGTEWCSDDLLGWLRRLATRLGLPLHTHVAESLRQHHYARQEYGVSSVGHLNRLHFLDSTTVLVHGVWLTAEDVAVCAAAGTSVVTNPSSNLRLRAGILPWRDLVAGGVNVALGMDSTTLSDNDDMFEEMRLAARLHSLPLGRDSRGAPTPSEIFQMATVNAAKAIQLPIRVGRLEPGWAADLVLLNSHRITGRMTRSDAVSVLDAVIYRATSHDVDTVIVGGRTLLAGGSFVFHDEAKVVSELIAAARVEPPPRVKRWRELLVDLKPFIDCFYENWPKQELSPDLL